MKNPSQFVGRTFVAGWAWAVLDSGGNIYARGGDDYELIKTAEQQLNQPWPALHDKGFSLAKVRDITLVEAVLVEMPSADFNAITGFRPKEAA